VEIQVLGRPAVRIHGDSVELTGRQPALLGALVVAAPRPVASDGLVEVIWGDGPPADPANALQQRVSALRQVLDPGRTGTVLVTVPGGYALRVDASDPAPGDLPPGDPEPCHLDVHRFERLAASGGGHLAAGDAEAARRDLDAALALWRGPAFDGVADEAWAVAEVQRLEQLRLNAREDRVEAGLALGGGADLVPELTELVAAEPLRERLSGQLMRALYRAGRQADALAEYERIRHELADELGVDPGPDLRRVHLQVLEQADDLEVEVLSTPRRARATTNVPAATRSVIGRAGDLERVAQLLASSRLVTLTGPGGAGKTTLAVEVARQQTVPEDGTWLVELAALRDGAAVAHTVANTLGVAAGVGGSEVDATRLAELLRDRTVLIILDNCEHVVAEVADLVHTLLTHAPQVRVLATSREPLAIDGELVWSLPTLGVPAPDDVEVDAVLAAPAVQLLVDRIQTHEPTFGLDAGSAPAAATIVRRLDGIPLAIELAAARHRVLPLPELAAALDDRFSVLSDTRRTAPTRQRTLRGAIDWSWDLLDREQRAAWAALSVPVDGADRSMAEALLAASGVTAEPLDAIRDLVDRSLVTVATTGDGRARYRMLESLRAYGQERLRDLGLEEVVRACHTEVVEEALDRCHVGDDPGAFGVDLDGLRDLLGDARTAMRWAADVDDLPRVQRLAGRLGWWWLLGGLATEGLRWLDLGFGAVDGAPPGHLDVEVADPDAALWASGLRTGRLHPDGVAWAALARDAADRPDRVVLAELFSGVHLAHRGEIEVALERLTAAVAQAEPIGGWLLGFAHLLTAQVGRVSGRFAQVREHAEAALRLLELPWARVQAIDIIIDAADPAADTLDAVGPETDPERTRQLATEGLALCRRGGFPELEGRMVLQLGVAATAAGDQALGAAYLEEAIDLTSRVGRGPSLGFALLVAGEHALRRGDLDLARDQLTEARALLAETGLGYGSARAGLALGRTLMETGDVEAARELTGEAVAQAQEVGDPELLAELASLSEAIDAAQA
jgi:predicted ATPase/DNA-binding SARP family transcriptional activator/tetratricopeptide (TPR) repeat protein